MQVQRPENVRDAGHPAHGRVPGARGADVGDLVQGEAAGAVARGEEGCEVGAAGCGAHGAAHAVAGAEELVRGVGEREKCLLET